MTPAVHYGLHVLVGYRVVLYTGGNPHSSSVCDYVTREDYQSILLAMLCELTWLLQTI